MFFLIRSDFFPCICIQFLSRSAGHRLSAERPEKGIGCTSLILSC